MNIRLVLRALNLILAALYFKGGPNNYEHEFRAWTADYAAWLKNDERPYGGNTGG